MTKFIKPPSLSTNFSQSGKQAKKRFENILNTNVKKTGVMAFALVISVTLLCGTLIACKNGSSVIGGKDGPTSIYVTDDTDNKDIVKVLYDSKLQYIGNAPGIGKILNLLGEIDGATPNGMELETTKAPYGIIRNFTGNPTDIKDLEKQTAIILALVDNADYVSYVFGDKKYSYNREELNNLYTKPLSEYSQSLDSFKELYNLVYAPVVISADEAVSKAIMEENMMGYGKGECMAEGHIILDSKENNNGTEHYTLVTYGEYGFENGNFIKISGSGIIPVRITFDKNNNLLEYLQARDGNQYAPSVKEMFPENLWNRALSHDDNAYRICREQERKYAQNYLDSIGRTAEIGEYRDFEHKFADMNVQVSNDLGKIYFDYPNWIGTQEKKENGVRIVYEKQWEEKEQIVTFKKYEYDSKKVIEETVIDTKNGEIKYLKGSPRKIN